MVLWGKKGGVRPMVLGSASVDFANKISPKQAASQELSGQGILSFLCRTPKTIPVMREYKNRQVVSVVTIK